MAAKKKRKRWGIIISVPVGRCNRDIRIYNVGRYFSSIGSFYLKKDAELSREGINNPYWRTRVVEYVKTKDGKAPKRLWNEAEKRSVR